MAEDEFEQYDWDEEVEQRRCRICRRSYEVRKGQKVRYCPYCGAAQMRGKTQQSFYDPRAVREL